MNIVASCGHNLCCKFVAVAAAVAADLIVGAAADVAPVVAALAVAASATSKYN